MVRLIYTLVNFWVGRMFPYRFYSIDSSGRISKPAMEAECLDDDAAMKLAWESAATCTEGAEVWSGARFVGTAQNPAGFDETRLQQSWT